MLECRADMHGDEQGDQYADPAMQGEQPGGEILVGRDHGRNLEQAEYGRRRADAEFAQ